MSFIAAVELVLDDAEVVGWSTRRSVPLGRYWAQPPIGVLVRAAHPARCRVGGEHALLEPGDEVVEAHLAALVAGKSQPREGGRPVHHKGEGG